jgi:hypothetical protein
MNQPVQQLIDLQGQIERVTYTNDENGYTIARLKVYGQKELVTITGNLMVATPDETIKTRPHTPKKGWKVIEEYPIGGGKTVDLACLKNSHKLAMEIETSSSYELYNVKKCLKAGFDEIRTIRV